MHESAECPQFTASSTDARPGTLIKCLPNTPFTPPGWKNADGNRFLPSARPSTSPSPLPWPMSCWGSYGTERKDYFLVTVHWLCRLAKNEDVSHWANELLFFFIMLSFLFLSSFKIFTSLWGQAINMSILKPLGHVCPLALRRHWRWLLAQTSCLERSLLMCMIHTLVCISLQN